MKRLATLTTLFVFSLACVSQAAITINVTPSYGPNGLAGTPGYLGPTAGSPGGYVSNALNTLMGLPTSGTTWATDPAAFEAVTGLVNPSDAIATTFPSWRGMASPSGEFANERGNRIFFGVAIETDTAMSVSGGGNGIQLNDLSLEKCWQDIDGSPSSIVSDPITSFSFAGSNYTDVRVGVLYGADGGLGGGDDTLITSGAGTQPVDAIVYIGATDAITFGFGPQYSYDPNLSEQENLDNLAAGFGDPAHPQQVLKTCYTIDGVEGCGDVVFVPEPAANLLILVGLVFFAIKSRQR